MTTYGRDRTLPQLRTEPGSASMSKAPVSCGLMAASCVVGALVYLTVGASWWPLYHVLAAIILFAVALSLGFIGSWASREKRQPSATLADLMPQRALAIIVVFLAAVLCVFLT